MPKTSASVKPWLLARSASLIWVLAEPKTIGILMLALRLFSHVADVSGLSALTLALTAHAKTNISMDLPIPTCGPEFIIPDFESPLQVAFCTVVL